MKSDNQKKIISAGLPGSTEDEGENARIGKRIQYGTQALIQKNFQILLNNEFVEHLPNVLHDGLQREESELVLELLASLGESATGEESILRKRSVGVLSLFLDQLLQEKTTWLIQDIVRILTDWLRVETEHSPTYNVVCDQLLEWGKSMFRKDRFEDIDYLLMVIHHIESGHIQKPNVITSQLCRMQKEFASDDTVDGLLQISLLEDKQSNLEARSLLAHMGPGATDYLIDKLLICESKEQRLQLMRIITSRGTSISGQLVKRLEHESPWNIIRDIIMMMSMIDDSSLFPHIKKFLSHEDIRVQQQVLYYIEKKGQGRKNQYLAEALFLTCDELKLKVIMQLASIGSEEILEVFMNLLALRKSFSKPFHDELLIKLCIALEETTQVRAINLLRQIIDEQKNLSGTDDKVIRIAETSLNKIEPRIRHVHEKLNDEENEADGQNGFIASPGQDDLEEEVTQLMWEGQYKVVEEMYYDRALSALKEHDYVSAEHFCDRILQIGPDDMSRVDELSGMIEQAKGKETSSSNIDIWSGLKEMLSENEFELFYNSLRQQKYDTDEIIVKHGNLDPCLYFIKSGFVSLTCLCGNYESFLKRLRQGDVVGVLSFFDASAWSVTLIAQKDVHLYSLEYGRFVQLAQKYPALEKKLYEYCVARDQIPELLKMSGDERRQSPRFQVRAMIRNTLLDRFGMVGRKVFKSEIVGISTGGLRCLTRINKKGNARLLLGRMIISRIETGHDKHLECKGTVIGVTTQKEMDLHYALHVRFDNQLSQTSVEAVVNYNKDD